jgi:hypothetical protein
VTRVFGSDWETIPIPGPGGAWRARGNCAPNLSSLLRTVTRLLSGNSTVSSV